MCHHTHPHTTPTHHTQPSLTHPLTPPAPTPRRYYLEIVGRRRITITSTSDQDGYRVACVTHTADTPLQPDSEEAQRLSTVAAQVSEGPFGPPLVA